MNLEGQIINLNKLAFEKDSKHKMKILERAYTISLSPEVKPGLKVVTAINLSSFYHKENLDFRGMCVLSDTLSALEAQSSLHWEKSVLLINLAALKSSLHSRQESISDLHKSLEFLSKVPETNLNYFTFLISVHLNLFTEFNHLQNYQKSSKHLLTAYNLSSNNLNPAGPLAKHITLFLDSHKSLLNPSPYNSPSSRLQISFSTRSKSNSKNYKKLKIFKKFEKVSQSFDFFSMKNKKKTELWRKIDLVPPLGSLLEEDENCFTSYPKFTLDSSKSQMNSQDREFVREVPSRDPDPEPGVKDPSFARIKEKVRNRLGRKGK